MPVAIWRGAAEDLVDDGLAVDREHHRLADALVGEFRVLVVDREVVDGGARRDEGEELRILGEAQIVFRSERPDGGVGFAGFETDRANRRLGHDLFAEGGEVRLAAEMVGEGFELGELGGAPLLQLEGAGTDRFRLVGVVADRGVVLRGHDELRRDTGEEGRVGLLEGDDDGVGIRRLNRCDQRT